MFEFYRSKDNFSEKEERWQQHVQFIMPGVPALVKRKSYAVYKMPGCSEIMVSPEEVFSEMINNIDNDINLLTEKITDKRKRNQQEDIEKLKKEKMDLIYQKNFIYSNKFDFIYRGSGYQTPVSVPASFLEEIGINEQNDELCIAYNVNSGEIIIHSEADKWKYDYSGESDVYRERRSGSIFMKKFVG